MKLIFKGVVQGVGFRPTIYRIAKELNLKGYVLNKGSEVEVVIDEKKDEFIKKVKENLPSIAKITEIIELIDNRKFSDFKILHSKTGERQSLIPIDVGICNDCLQELFDKKNRRYLFPFTNCTVCGARYSLVKDVPYDRERTSMDDFKLCKNCQVEYKDPLDRRYHAQTISCPKCGPKYFLYDKKKKNLGEKDAIKRFANQIDAGKIGVIKSWGGMHLCCNISQISRFREWYGRPQKSFALMVKDIKSARKFADISKDEEELLLSKSRPIVLLNKICCEEVSPGLNTIGIFLPYTGLHHLLFSNLKSDALVMTSSNVPGEAMITTDEEAFSIDANIYLLHNRSIPNRVDDSVVRMWKGNTFFIRRSRGYVPEPIAVSYSNRILSVGAGENITGAISNKKNVYATQYIGNSKYYSTLGFLEESLDYILKLIMKKPNIDAVVQDLHPGYDSRIVAKNFSEKFSAPLFEVQHHWAHAVSLLVDRKLDESVVLTLDGLGYGSDGTYWGGEILVSNFLDFNRASHLEYIPLLGGDQATRDPRRLVFAIFKKFGIEKFFTGNEATILSKLMGKSPKSCSLGRVLDALSCYLNICTKRTYDGEPAMKLEKYLSIGKYKYSFDCEVKNDVVGTIDLFRQLDEKIKKPLNEKEKADYVYSFVKTILDNLTKIAIENSNSLGINNVGLTGGVSYNIPIVEMIEEQVKKAGLKLIVHNQIPNGDGGISIGQNAIIGHKLSS
ncbi:MAG: [NiFe] hydrogenase metallocenter assembly protein HypF [Thermoplasmatales archaeon SG8-52-3]|nr:MAG: [NiFe] hydrogenase metallocenter assembly protein HypF [Thermoplasmatales archaeon SG8-52-3]